MIKKLGKNKYRFTASVGSGKNRKRPTKTIEFNGGKKELQRLYNEFEDECKNRPQTDITVEQLVNDYILRCKSLGRKKTTIHGYEIALKRLSSPTQATLAKNCTTYRLQKEIAEMSSNGLGAKSVKNTISLLSASYRQAIRLGLLNENPCEKLVMPSGKQKEVRILYENEIQPFLTAMAGLPVDDKVAYELALFMGLRRSEILGLKEADADIVNGVLTIHNTRHRIDQEDYDDDTKTDRSTRTLAVPEILIMDIAILLETHRRLRYGSVDYLIQNGWGETITPQALSSRLARFEKRNGLPPVTLHGLRHTYASLLNAKGIDMSMISRELGHSNLSTTQNIYTHIFKRVSEASKDIAKTVDLFVDETKSLSQNATMLEEPTQDVVVKK